MNREAPDILVRTKSDYDGAEPSGNSIAVLNLLRLSQFTEDSNFREKAEKTLGLFASKVASYPYAMPEMMTGAMWILESPMQIVFAGVDVSMLKAEVNAHYLPRSVRMKSSESLGEFAKSLAEKNGSAGAYICHNFVCELPVSEPEELKKLLNQ